MTTAKKSSSKKSTHSSQSASVEKKTIMVTDKEGFDTAFGSAGEKVVMVEFYATWCGPCKIIGPKLEELAIRYQNEALIIRVDVDEYEELAMEHGVVSMPTFAFFKNKVKLAQFAGSTNEKLEKTLEKLVGNEPVSRPMSLKPNQSGNPEDPAPTQSSNPPVAPAPSSHANEIVLPVVTPPSMPTSNLGPVDVAGAAALLEKTAHM